MKNSALLTVIVAIVVGVAGFFAGVQYQRSQRQDFGNQSSASDHRGGQFQGVTSRNGFRPVNGQIISNDSNSITIKLQDGSSRIILLDNKTQINKAVKASKSDLATGQTVAVFGQENSDGSMTAQNIQLNPQFRGMGGGTPPAQR